MRKLKSLLIILAWILTIGGNSFAKDLPITDVTMFEGDFASVNSFIFSNGKSLIVLDVQRKKKEALQLIEVVKAQKLPLTHILISHGHTDHFTGMGYFKAAFPNAKIVVANDDIKRSIKEYAVYMNSGGETGAEPALDQTIRPKTIADPDGFDYENNIHSLDNDQLSMVGGGTLKLTTDYKPAEADYITTIYSKDLNALFLTDFGYNGVHHWQGDDITWQDIANWREELLRIKADYADLQPIVYPGHGGTTDMSVFDTMVGYIDNYTAVVKGGASRAEAMAEMVALYPDYKEANFFLKYSLENHIKE